MFLYDKICLDVWPTTCVFASIRLLFLSPTICNFVETAENLVCNHAWHSDKPAKTLYFPSAVFTPRHYCSNCEASCFHSRSMVCHGERCFADWTSVYMSICAVQDWYVSCIAMVYWIGNSAVCISNPMRLCEGIVGRSLMVFAMHWTSCQCWCLHVWSWCPISNHDVAM